MSDGEHPYRAGLKRELDALTEETLRQLDEGYEMPFDENVFNRAAHHVNYRRAGDQAAEEGHPAHRMDDPAADQVTRHHRNPRTNGEPPA
jgi:hypothetical protein